MRRRLPTWVFYGLAWVGLPANVWGQTSGNTFNWTGEVSSDATNGANWLLGATSGTAPGPQDYVEFRQGDRPPIDVNYGSTNVTYEHILFNHADVGTTINGTGTITLTETGGPQNVDIKSMETQSGPRLSTINANVFAHGMLEARNAHDIVFNGASTFTTVHAYINDDQIEKSDVTFNGPFTHTGYGEARFMTGTGAVHFNNEVTLDHQTVNEGFGIRNGLTLVLEPNFSAFRFLPDGGGGPGLDTVDMYNNSTVRLEADSLVGNDTDLFSRFGGGQNPNNTLDLNGFSDHVEFLGTHLEANFIVDFGDTAGANSFLWETTYHHVGTYEFVNFEIGVDTLTLGDSLASPWWTSLDTNTDGGGSSNTEVDKSHMTINGIPYGAFDAGRTTPYWTLVDPDVSRDVEIFNVQEPDANFNGVGLVDGRDFLIWQRGRGLTGQTTNANGDADHDGTVDNDDLAVWRSAFGTAGATAAAGGVPEPSSLLLSGLAVVGAAGWRRRRIIG